MAGILIAIKVKYTPYVFIRILYKAVHYHTLVLHYITSTHTSNTHPTALALAYTYYRSCSNETADIRMLRLLTITRCKILLHCCCYSVIYYHITTAEIESRVTQHKDTQTSGPLTTRRYKGRSLAAIGVACFRSHLPAPSADLCVRRAPAAPSDTCVGPPSAPGHMDSTRTRNGPTINTSTDTGNEFHEQKDTRKANIITETI